MGEIVYDLVSPDFQRLELSRALSTLLLEEREGVDILRVTAYRGKEPGFKIGIRIDGAQLENPEVPFGERVLILEGFAQYPKGHKDIPNKRYSWFKFRLRLRLHGWQGTMTIFY